MSKAFCMASYTMNETVQTTMNGYLLMEGMPCEDGEPCANCLTFALETGNGLYYLVTENEQIKNTLNALMMNELPRQATITGVPFKQGSFDYIQVYDITIGAYRLRHLCDEWNVLKFRYNWGAVPDEYRFVKYRLTTDTMIICPTCYTSPENYTYTKLEEDGKYKGALREGTNRDIYYIPADSTNVYLLYAFNAEVGDTLTNVWLGVSDRDMISVKTATIKEIKQTFPRIFVIDLEYWSSGISEISRTEIEWIEGVGCLASPDAEYFSSVVPGGFSSILLCAYKNGKQVYTSELAEEYGCEFKNDSTHSIPLYIKDGPGSSTVEPVDPNQIIATLKKDWLSIFVSLDKEITYSLTRAIIPNKMPARNNTNSSNTFRESVSVQLTEPGTYTLQLTNPEWDYVIVGTFDYVSGYMSVEQTDSPAPSVQKILRNGQLLFLRDGGIYTITGLKIQ